MKIKRPLYAVLLPAKKDGSGLFTEEQLAIGAEDTLALYCTRKPAAAFARELRVQAEIPARVVRVKATFKIKKGGRK